MRSRSLRHSRKFIQAYALSWACSCDKPNSCALRTRWCNYGEQSGDQLKRKLGYGECQILTDSAKEVDGNAFRVNERPRKAGTALSRICSPRPPDSQLDGRG
jgi:hypothetical protein